MMFSVQGGIPSARADVDSVQHKNMTEHNTVVGISLWPLNSTVVKHDAWHLPPGAAYGDVTRVVVGVTTDGTPAAIFGPNDTPDVMKHPMVSSLSNLLGGAKPSCQDTSHS